jgi:hypothetical protein
MIARFEAMLADQQLVDLGQSEGTLAREPASNPLPVLGHLPPFLAAIGCLACLHSLPDLMNLLVGQLAITRQGQLLGDPRVPRHRLAVGSCLS